MNLYKITLFFNSFALDFIKNFFPQIKVEHKVKADVPDPCMQKSKPLSLNGIVFGFSTQKLFLESQ